MGPYDRPGDDGPVLRLADLPYSFTENHGGRHAVLHIEDEGGGVLAVVTKKGKQRVWTVTKGEEIPVEVAQILDETTEEVDGYSVGTATDVAKVRAYLWD